MSIDRVNPLPPGEIIGWQDSLDVISGHEALSPAGRLLAENVIRLGRVFPLQTDKGKVMVLDVKQFLNHRVDTGLMMMVGEEIANKFRLLRPKFVLTAPSSGISPAFAVAVSLGNIPLIYTQRTAPVTFNDGPVLSTDSFSYTTGKPEPMTASSFCIPNDEIGIAVDDFLDTGNKSRNLAEITRQASSSLVGLGYAIEKSQYGGRLEVAKAGVSYIHSVLDIALMEPGKIKLSGIPFWLSLQNNGQ